MTKTERIESYKNEYLKSEHVEFLRRHFPGIGEINGFELLEGGEDNINMMLRGKDGKAEFAVRHYIVSPPGKVRRELELVKLLADNGFPTPEPVPTGDGDLFLDRGDEPCVAVFPFVDGTHEYDWSKEQHHEAGAILARMHNICIKNNYRLGNVKKRVETLRQGITIIADSHLKEKEKLIQEAERFLEEDYTPNEALLNALPTGPVHHDLNHGNVFWGQDKHITAVIDFDECHDAPFVIDIMAAFHYLALDDDKKLAGDICLDLIEGYRGERELSREEIKALPLCWDFLNIVHAMEFVLEFKKHLDSVMECRTYKEIYLPNRHRLETIISGLL